MSEAAPEMHAALRLAYFAVRRSAWVWRDPLGFLLEICSILGLHRVLIHTLSDDETYALQATMTFLHLQTTFAI